MRLELGLLLVFYTLPSLKGDYELALEGTFVEVAVEVADKFDNYSRNIQVLQSLFGGILFDLCTLFDDFLGLNCYAAD